MQTGITGALVSPTFPAGWTAGGLPAGLQVIGRHLGDPLVLKASACFERARPWQGRRPPVLDS